MRPPCALHPFFSCVGIKSRDGSRNCEEEKIVDQSIAAFVCAPLRIVPRALLSRSGSSCTRAPHLVLLSRLRAAMAMARSCDSDNAPQKRVHNAYADLRGTSSPRCTAPGCLKDDSVQ